MRWKLASVANYAAADLTEDLSELRGVISGLAATTAYTLQVRAGNNIDDSDWVDASASTGRNKLDVNANGDADWRDGILLARYAFGLRGDALASGDFNTAAAAAIISNIEGAASLLNVDGVGNDMSAADGMLLARYLLGVEGDALIAGITTASAATIAANILAALRTAP
ncbi:MAG: hypothetical protein OD817_06950 [Gammaproteobacteria bacterium]